MGEKIAMEKVAGKIHSQKSGLKDTQSKPRVQNGNSAYPEMKNQYQGVAGQGQVQYP